MGTRGGIHWVAAHTPKWDNENHTAISLEVKFDHLPSFVSFTASPHDVEKHSQDLFDRAEAGEFGKVAEYEPKVITVNALKARAIRELNLADEERRLMAMLNDPNAPQAVKDYAEAIRENPNAAVVRR